MIILIGRPTPDRDAPERRPMIPRHVLTLMAALYGSVILGLIFPRPSTALSPYIGPMMMILLFMSFLKLSPRDIWAQISGDPMALLIGAALKLIVLPIAAYGLTWLVYPRLALGAILIGGCSTAVAAPFFVSLVGGSIPYALIMAVVTSLLMPLTLPLMIRLLGGAVLSFDLAALAWFLFRLIFIPLAAAFLVRRFWPGLDLFFNRISSRLSLILISDHQFQQPGALRRLSVLRVGDHLDRLFPEQRHRPGRRPDRLAGRRPESLARQGDRRRVPDIHEQRHPHRLGGPPQRPHTSSSFRPVTFCRFNAILVGGAWFNSRPPTAQGLIRGGGTDDWQPGFRFRDGSD